MCTHLSHISFNHTYTQLYAEGTVVCVCLFVCVSVAEAV